MVGLSEGKKPRCRYCCFTIFKDSAPEDWSFYLDELYVPCFISPKINKPYNDTFEPYNDCRTYRYKVQIVILYQILSADKTQKMW